MFSFKTVFVSGKCATVNSESSPTILLDSSRIISISFLKKKKKEHRKGGRKEAGEGTEKRSRREGRKEGGVEGGGGVGMEWR